MVSLYKMWIPIFLLLLASYGVGVGKEMVLDRICDYRRLGGSTEGCPIRSTRWSEAAKAILPQNIGNIVLYLASEIANLDTMGLEFTPILKTSANSAKLSGPVFSLQPVLYNRPSLEYFSHPPIVVGAVFKGPMQSYFASDGVYSRAGFTAQTSQAELVIYGDRELMMDPDNPMYSDRNFIVLNAIDYLRGDESMIRIRSRSIQTSFLDVREYMERKNMLWGRSRQDREKHQANRHNRKCCNTSNVAYGGNRSLLDGEEKENYEGDKKV